MEFGDEPLDFQIPDVAEPIRGYRTWSVEYRESHSFGGPLSGPFRLTSSFGRGAWKPDDPVIAECGNSSIDSVDRKTRGRACGESPSRSKEGHYGYGCGIYSYRDPVRAASYHNPSSFKNSIWGEILMWGNVYEHEHGYRAQYACVSAIALMKNPWFVKMAEGLAKVYEVGLIYDLREISEEGKWNPLTRTLEATLSEADFLLDSSVNGHRLPYR